MHDVEGYTHEEISGALMIPVGTSKSHLVFRGFAYSTTENAKTVNSKLKSSAPNLESNAAQLKSNAAKFALGLHAPLL